MPHNYRNTSHTLAVALCLSVLLGGLVFSLHADPSTSLPNPQDHLAPPQVRFMELTQTGPKSDYTLWGFPGSAAPGQQLWCRYSDDSEHLVATVAGDGYFQGTLHYEKAQQGYTLQMRDPAGSFSSSCTMPLDYRLMGGHHRKPTLHGFVNLIPSSQDVETHGKRWFALAKRLQEADGSTPRLDATIFNVHAMSLGMVDHEHPATPQDLVIYGYTPKGTVVTCILGWNGLSFSTHVDAEGRFVLRLPAPALEIQRQPKGRIGMFIINVTDGANHLLSSTSFDPGLPQWVTR